MYLPAVHVAGYCFVFDRGFGQAFSLPAWQNTWSCGKMARYPQERSSGDQLFCKPHLRVMAGQTDLVFAAKNNLYLEGWSQKTGDNPNSGNSIDYIQYMSFISLVF